MHEATVMPVIYEPSADELRPPPAAAVFDEADLLLRLRHNGTLADRVLRLFLDGARDLLDQAERAVTAGDLPETAKVAHTLKGSSLNVSAPRVAQAAQRLESLAKNAAADPAALAQSLEVVRDEVSEVQGPIEARLRRRG